MLGRTVVSDRNNAPLSIDIKKLPPGHAIFRPHGTQLKGLIVAHGAPYDLGGKRLESDTGWLRKEGYMVNDDILKLIAQHQVPAQQAPQQKNCIRCSADIKLEFKFCSECGASQGEQKVWTPDIDDEQAAVLARLIDPANPLGSLEVLTNAPPPAPRRTPDQIFQELQANESQTAAKELKAGGGLAAAVADAVSYKDEKFGDIQFDPREVSAKPKG